MVRKILSFFGVYLLLILTVLIVSFWVWQEPTLYGQKIYNLFFIPSILYPFAVILALIFRNTFIIKDLPYYFAGLMLFILVVVITPAMYKSSVANKAEWDQKFTTTKRDFLCTTNSYITYFTEEENSLGRFIKYSQEPNEENVTLVADVDDQAKTIKPIETSAQLIPQEFVEKYSCKNEEGKTIFDYYKFQPDIFELESFIGMHIVEQGVAKNTKDGAVIDVYPSQDIYIDGLQEWTPDLLGKNLIVSGTINQSSTINDYGRQVPKYFFTKASWELNK